MHSFLPLGSDLGTPYFQLAAASEFVAKPPFAAGCHWFSTQCTWTAESTLRCPGHFYIAPISIAASLSCYSLWQSFTGSSHCL